ncbi:MAG: hypothetical protein JW754_00780 [Candidatus Aenigmarchaeota archaeon]|nr:hypothetical protein [Candidatus Aenigmarchaeota archaeon]
MNLDSLFYPKSVLLIGSSKMRGKFVLTSPEIFREVKRNLAKFDGKKTFVDIDVSKVIPYSELVVITLPAKKVMEILPGVRGKFVIILSGGFSNNEKEEMVRISMRKKFRILGPNSVCGIIEPEKKLDTTFEKGMYLRKGKVSVVSQSGGIGATLLDLFSYHRVGISKFVWIGDAADINETDVLEYLVNDRETGIILMYAEGIRDTGRFMRTAKGSKKPILIMKGGISDCARDRALSHTGSLSTESRVYEAAFRQSGVTESKSLGELFNYALVIDHYKPVRGNRLAIVSNTGGSSILAADWCSLFGVELSKFSEKTKKDIRKSYSGIHPINPMDIIADADGKRYKGIIDILIKDKNVDGIVLVAQLKSCALKERDLRFIKKSLFSKPVIICAPGAGDFTKVKNVLADIPVFSSVKNAVKAFRNLHDFSKTNGHAKQ